MPKVRRYIADFDSSTSMLYALARCLHGKGFGGIGVFPAAAAGLARAVNALPRRARQAIYRASGAWEGFDPRRLRAVRAEAISQWVVDQYPARRYPAALIGASNGAAIHLAAALGVPWLPQTFLIPVRRRLAADDLAGDMRWGIAPARALLAANPELQLHHMHDPVNDRLMVARMGYFRVKRRRLGPCYETFLRMRVAPPGPLILIDCDATWPARRIAERHFFQSGGWGGTRADEYLNGGPRVEAFLRAQRANATRWTAPAPDGRFPEAEWGFEPALADSVDTLARAQGYRLRRLRFTDPEDLSPFVADLYRWWYRRRGRDDRRLLLEMFALVEPWWALRTAAVPFWLVFTAAPSADAAERYLDAAGPFDEIYLMLLSNGIDAIDLAPIARWRALLRRARRRGASLGADEDEFPFDLGAFLRYERALKRQLRERLAPPAPLGIDELEAFIGESAGRYRVQWSAER